ncbi:MAG: DUF3081 family protein [Pseudomonadota bacterium]
MRDKTTDGKVTSRLVLAAYQVIREQGQAAPDEDGVRELDGLTASGDFDGYTVIVSDGLVTVRALFHNQLDIQAPDGRALENFLKRLRRVAAGRH